MRVDYGWDEVGHVVYSLKDPANPHAYYGSRTQSEVIHCVGRGNEYHWRNGKQLHLMHFDSPKAEVAFYVMVDEIHQVKSPRSGNYQWTWGDIQQAVAAGRSMAPRMSPGFFGAKPMLICYEIPESMPELARKIREEFIAGNPEMEKMKQQADTPRGLQDEDIPDEDIDASNVPELTQDFFATATLNRPGESLVDKSRTDEDSPEEDGSHEAQRPH